MVKIYVVPHQFNPTTFPMALYPKLHQPDDLPCPWPRLIWAATTMGKRGPRAVVRWQARFGAYARSEMVYRSHILYANLMSERGTNSLLRSAAYRELEQTEKAAVSFFLGMTMAKLLAAAYVNTPWLTHLKPFERDYPCRLVFTPRNTNRRPDLIGITRGMPHRWIVGEAKGRTDVHASGGMGILLNDAKTQARVVRSISSRNGKKLTPPHLYFASVFSPTNRAITPPMELNWIDPEPDEDARLDFTFEVGDFMEHYYRPFVDLLGANHDDTRITDVNGQEFRILSLPDADIKVGLPVTVERAWLEGRYEEIPGALTIADGGANSESEGSDPSLYVGPDGILIQVGTQWSDEAMEHDVYER